MWWPLPRRNNRLTVARRGVKAMGFPWSRGALSAVGLALSLCAPAPLLSAQPEAAGQADSGESYPTLPPSEASAPPESGDIGVAAELSAGAEAAPASVLSLEPGEIHSLSVDKIDRVAVGDPQVVDVTVVSLKELLLKAASIGSTNLIVWDRQGKHVWNVEVVDRKPQQVETQLRRLLQDLNLPGVMVKRESGKLFLTGEVPTKEDVDRLEQMLGAFKDDVTNLVAVTPQTAAATGPPESVKLTVQVIEMNREAKDKFGVDWVDSLAFTETTFGVLGPQNVSQVARLGEAFRLGALSRSSLNSVLNMLVSKGKARILAEPKLVAASGKEANTTIGVEVPIITSVSISSGTVSQNIEFKQTGVELKFKPVVLTDGHSIQLALNAKVSSIDTASAITVSGIVVPGFRVRQTQTEIVTNSGQSVFITGLLQDEEKKNLAQLPAVGSIPVLGALFRSTEFTRGVTELIIVVTPELAAPAVEMTMDRALALEQSLASAEVADSINDPTRRYALQIQDRIAKTIRYPVREGESGMSGRVKLRLHLFRDGALGQAMIAESSGVEFFDAEALQAAKRQSYPPFPSDLVQQDLWLELPVLFRP